MSKTRFHHSLVLSVSLATLFGLALHETKADMLTSTLVGIPAMVATYGGMTAIALQGDAHTHVEHFSMSSAERVHQTSYVPPRLAESKKHLLQKNAPRGHHPFDNYTLPMIS